MDSIPETLSVDFTVTLWFEVRSGSETSIMRQLGSELSGRARMGRRKCPNYHVQPSQISINRIVLRRFVSLLSIESIQKA